MYKAKLMIRTTLAIMAAALLATGCRKIIDDSTDGNANAEGRLSGRITSDMTLKAGKEYKLSGIVYVTNGAKLTVEPGTVIKGEKSTRGTLVITRGSQILASGTASSPIVFTSDAATPAMGDWGGVVIAGRARTNASYNGVQGVGEIEGGVNNSEGFGLYGGNNDNDNSGKLQYVRIEYAGYAFLPDKELNGLTLAAVGRGTTIDHIQVSYAADDSYEFFGGTVDAKYLISYKCLDDDFDMDNGYNGRLQFGIAFRDSAIADISQSNGLEVDNDAAGSVVGGLPQTSPVISNFTLIGPRATLSNVGNTLFRRGAHLRRNSAASIFNSIIMGWPTGINIDGSTGQATDLNYTGGTPQAVLSNNILAGNGVHLLYSANPTQPTGWTSAELLNYFTRTGSGNSIFATNAEAGLIAAFRYDSGVDFNPAAGTAAATGGSFANARLNNTFFTAVSFRGAASVGDNWWKGWTKF